MKLPDKKLNFVVDYALCYLFAAWDENIQADLDMDFQEFVKIINKFQGNKIKIKQYPNE